MGKFCLAIYLILVGIFGLITVAVPGWVLAALAIIVGLILIYEGWSGRKATP